MSTRQSLRRAIFLAVLLGLLLPAAVTALIATRYFYGEVLERTVNASLTVHGEVLALGLADPLWAYDSASVSRQAEALARNPDICRVEVRDLRQGRVIAVARPEHRTGRSFTAEWPILHDAQQVGTLMLEMSDGVAVTAVRSRLRTLAFTLLGQVVVSTLLIAWVLERRVVRPLRTLGAHADAIARGQLDAPIAPHHVDEIGELGERLDITRRSLRDSLSRQATQQAQLEHDLSERRRAEDAARHSEARLLAMVEQSPIAIIEIGLNGDIQGWNSAAELAFGWRREEVLGRHVRMLMATEDSAVLADIFRVVAHASGGWHQEGENRTRDGRTITCWWHLNLVRDGAGVPQRIVAMVEDVSERRLAEQAQQRMTQALRASEERFSLAFHEAPVAMSLINAESFVLQDVNRAMEALLGYAREEIVNRSPDELRMGVDQERSADLLARLLAAEEVSDFDYVLAAKDGHRVHVRFWARLIPYSDPPLALHIMIDVTERVRIEQELARLNQTLEARVAARTRELEDMLGQLQQTQDELIQSEKLAALGGLVAGVAHELNTPIGNAMLTASSLRDSARDIADQAQRGLRRSSLQGFVDDADSATEILLRNLERAGELISSFKQIAVDQTSSQRRKFELAALVHEIIITLKPSLKKTPFQIVSAVPEGLGFDSYPGPLGQVLTNLVNNAVLHGLDGRDAGVVTIEAHAQDDGQVELVVRDDGLGIPAEHQRRIFEPFFTTKRGAQGTGLGLHIAHNIVSAVLGGQISVESEPGRGTTMRIVLPRVAPVAETRGAPASPLG